MTKCSCVNMLLLMKQNTYSLALSLTIHQFCMFFSHFISLQARRPLQKPEQNASQWRILAPVPKGSECLLDQTLAQNILTNVYLHSHLLDLDLLLKANADRSADLKVTFLPHQKG